ncbi:MAG: dTDP-4-dehydrorhamnose 3,5-epimerase [Synergistaceae bacterium]|jgi:dTDP-4-dehydrorhamnose 3,5-epimerase|nr:dTDP-4-dehydrorhamnose 3,5-epimerase [Synergistaceae bacterium]
MNNFTLSPTNIDGLLLIKTKKFGDDRGFFTEIFNERSFEELGLHLRFVQDNRSRSRRGTLRGLHFQKTRPQGKLVCVTSGEVFDVAVDLRRSSANFGKWSAATLTGDGGAMFYIPPGLAHGFYVISEFADISYKCTDFYVPEDESGILWSDPSVGIEWPERDPSRLIISDKDKNHPMLGDCVVYP